MILCLSIFGGIRSRSNPRNTTLVLLLTALDLATFACIAVPCKAAATTLELRSSSCVTQSIETRTGLGQIDSP